MKRLVLVLALLVALCGTAHAGWAVPPLKAGVGYSLVDSGINNLFTIEALKWKFLNLEVGYAGDSDSTDHKGVVALTTNLLNLEKLGVTVPLAKIIDVNLGIYAGVGRINVKDWDESELDYGLSCTLVNLHF